MYDVLFTPEDPDGEAAKMKAKGKEAAAEEEDDEGEEEDDAGAPGWIKLLNPQALTTCKALVEPCLRKEAAPPPKHTRPSFQFQRVGYFCVDESSTSKAPVFNRVVALKEDREKKSI